MPAICAQTAIRLYKAQADSFLSELAQQAAEAAFYKLYKDTKTSCAHEDVLIMSPNPPRLLPVLAGPGLPQGCVRASPGDGFGSSSFSSTAHRRRLPPRPPPPCQSWLDGSSLLRATVLPSVALALPLAVRQRTAVKSPAHPVVVNVRGVRVVLGVGTAQVSRQLLFLAKTVVPTLPTLWPEELDGLAEV